MFEKIENLYLEISNWLIQKIDADPNYKDPVEQYLIGAAPDEYALFKALEQMLNKLR
jgi:hypothetical protein